MDSAKQSFYEGHFYGKKLLHYFNINIFIKVKNVYSIDECGARAFPTIPNSNYELSAATFPTRIFRQNYIPKSRIHNPFEGKKSRWKIPTEKVALEKLNWKNRSVKVRDGKNTGWKRPTENAAPQNAPRRDPNSRPDFFYLAASGRSTNGTSFCIFTDETKVRLRVKLKCGKKHAFSARGFRLYKN